MSGDFDAEALVVTSRVQERLAERIADAAEDIGNLSRLASYVYSMGPLDPPLPELARTLDRNPDALDLTAVGEVLRQIAARGIVPHAGLDACLVEVARAAREAAGGGAAI